MNKLLILTVLFISCAIPAAALPNASGLAPEYQFGLREPVKKSGHLSLGKVWKLRKALGAQQKENDGKNTAAKVLVGLSIAMGIAGFLVLFLTFFGLFLGMALLAAGAILAIIGLRKNKKSANPSRIVKILGIISLVVNAVSFLALLGLIVAFFIVFG